MSRKRNLDRFDYNILEILQSDALITNKKLSNLIELSPPATLERVRKLIKKGYLLKPHYTLNWEKLYFNFKILLVANIAPNDRFLYLKAIEACPQILQTNQIKQEETLGLFQEKLRFMSIGIFRDQEGFGEAWLDISSKTRAPIKFHIWELGEEYNSKGIIPLIG